MENLAETARQLFGIRLNDRQVAALAVLERELLDWNEKVNLTAVKDADGVRTKHFLDSFSCVLAWRENPPKRMVDVGTGAGFPGIPLKILYPAMRLTLVESVGKKAAFCRHLVETLKLEAVDVLAARAEEVGQMSSHREGYDWAVARAVADLPILAEYLLPLVRIGGAMLAQKGESGPAETHRSEAALKMLGGLVRQLIPITLPGVVETRFLVVADKVAATPPQYPRRPGMPAKKPL